MSAGLLYHILGVRGYRLLKEKIVAGGGGVSHRVGSQQGLLPGLQLEERMAQGRSGTQISLGAHRT